jgi:aldehyde:ferredoxin oxidoreductase
MKGYMGKILRIDLTRKDVRTENLDEDMARLYIGGSELPPLNIMLEEKIQELGIVSSHIQAEN